MDFVVSAGGETGTSQTDLGLREEQADRRPKRPDYDHWSKVAYWTLEETVCLCCEVDPGKRQILPDADGERFEKVQRLVVRAARAGAFSDPVKPAEFTLWVKANGIPFPPELQRLALMRADNWVEWKAEAHRYKEAAECAAEGFQHYRSQVKELQKRVAQLESELRDHRAEKQKTRASDGETSPKSLKSLLRLVGGMAVAVYGYDPTQSRSDVIAQIQHDLDLKGVSIDADTIRKWVRQGAKTLQESGNS